MEKEKAKENHDSISNEKELEGGGMEDFYDYGGRYANLLGNGEVITGEGPGKGFLSLPWIFPEYIGALGLNHTEFFLACWLMKYSWENNGVVYPSTPKLARETGFSEKTLYKHLDGLEQKGYINRIDIKTPIVDRRIRRSLCGLFTALEFAVRCNPDSEYCKVNPQQNAYDLIENAPKIFRNFTTPKEVNYYYKKRSLIFNWAELAPDVPIPKRTQNYDCVCLDCHNEFLAGNPNAKRCPNCKQKLSDKRFVNFVNNKNEFEDNLKGYIEINSVR
jgi:hypothetical protein